MKTIQVPTLDDAMEQPMPWSEMGGADAIRYNVRVSEMREQLVAMLQKIDEAEMDGLYFGQDSSHVERFTTDIAELLFTFSALKRDAGAIADLMRMC